MNNMPGRSRRLPSISIACLFAILDLLLLAALPLLGLSYGEWLVPWLLLAGARLGIWLVWKAIGAWWPGKPGTRRGAIWALAIVNLLMGAVLVYGFYIEPFDLKITQIELPTAKLASGQSVRILQLSDLHIEYTTRRELDVLAQVQALQPDLIVITGDTPNLSYMNNEQTTADAREFLAQLSAPLGVYAINGSTDHRAQMEAFYGGLDNITVLEDESTLVTLPDGEQIALLGIWDENWERDSAAFTEAAREVPAEILSVLLYHTPDLAELAADAGMDLYLCGHTHGGQIRLPVYGAVITFSRFGKRFEAGEYAVKDMTLYVSRGIGMEGWIAPRARFLAPPELVLVTLTGTR